MKHVTCWCSIAALLFGAASSSADVHFFVDNPTANSADYAAYCNALRLTLDGSIDFSTHPDGPVIPTWFQASSGAVITTDGVTSVQTGDGSLSGNTTDPGGIGEGLLPEPATYLATGAGVPCSVEFTFDSPVSGFGIMTADLFQWGDATPSATLEAFDSAGALLGSTPSINTSFEFDYLYFMGVVDDDARIARIRFTNYGVAGDSVYLTQGWIARSFTPPCPADFNQDGGIDGADVEAFFSAWEAGDLSADVNQDGGVDGADVETFFAAWEAGGCG